MRLVATVLAFFAFAAPASAQYVQSVPWAAEQPSARDFRDTYPVRALADGVEGLVQLNCLIS